MNNARRSRIRRAEISLETDIQGTLEVLLEQIDRARAEFEAVKEEEEDSFESLPESLQEAERGQDMQSAIDCLEAAEGMLAHFAQYLEDFRDSQIAEVITLSDEAKGQD